MRSAYGFGKDSIRLEQCNFEIRPARIGDAEAVTECVAAAYDHYIERIGKPPGPMREDYNDMIQRQRVFVLADSAGIFGVLVLSGQNDSLLLDNVAVHPSYQGKGLGLKLMALAEKECLDMGYGAITLYTNELMAENIQQYKKNLAIWKPTGERTGGIGGCLCVRN